jgi:hypothetical protein
MYQHAVTLAASGPDPASALSAIARDAINLLTTASGGKARAAAYRQRRPLEH